MEFMQSIAEGEGIIDMPPKTKFTKQQIIDAAFEIARMEGIDQISIRKVAAKLGSSIAPIYVNFKEVDELIQEVISKTHQVSRTLLMEQNTGNPFHDIGVASLRFAKEYSVLYRDLVMKDNHHTKDDTNDLGILIDLMKQDPELKGFNDVELQDILFKMRIFQTGLSVMVANRLLPDHLQDDEIVEILDRTAMDIVAAARMRQNPN